mgnify:FL=1
MNTKRPKIAVIGAGWAGLSASVSLIHRADISLFEAGRQAGGRARALAGKDDGFSFLDNGQHILLGAYHGVQTLMQHIGVQPESVFLRQPLQWYIHEGLQFQTASLPVPWHLLVGILSAKNFSFPLKIKLLSDMSALQRWAAHHKTDLTVAKWLRTRNVPRSLLGQFWQPLVWGALNTPLEQASLRILCNVLSDGVWSEKANSDYLLPKQDLGRIVAEPALDFLHKHGAKIHLETRVSHLNHHIDGRIEINGEVFDAVILAVAPYHVDALLPKDTPDYIQTVYQSLHYHAITTVYLRYAQAVKLPAPLTGFSNGTAQWVLHRGALGLPDNEVAVVISVSDCTEAWKDKDLAENIHADIKRVCPDLGKPEAVRIITEKRATTAATVDFVQPDFSWLHHCRIYPAGDYLHPRYPATLEAAVQSGFTAAEKLMLDFRFE